MTLYSQAEPVPVPISVHILGWRLRSESHQRWKNGRPDHSTTGEANANSSQGRAAPSRPSKAPPDIAMTNTSKVSGSVRQKRRRKSSSSGLCCSSAVGMTGSSAMPHFGQVPGPTCSTSGCMGQLYRAPSSAGSTGAAGDSSGRRYLCGSAPNLVRHPALQKK